MKDTKTVYVVCWGSAGQDDDGNSTAYSGVAGVYFFKDDAQKRLEEYKNECYEEITNNPEDDAESKAYMKDNTKVYGSVEDDYFEIDYPIGDVPCEIYIHIVEQNIV